MFYRQNCTGSCEQTQHGEPWCQRDQPVRQSQPASYWISTKTLIITLYVRCSELIQPSITLFRSSVGDLWLGWLYLITVHLHHLQTPPSPNVSEHLRVPNRCLWSFDQALCEPLYSQLSHHSISSSCFLSLFCLPFVLLQQQQTANLLAVTKHWLSRGWFHWEALPDMRGALTWLTHTLYCCLIQEWGWEVQGLKSLFFFYIGLISR